MGEIRWGVEVESESGVCVLWFWEMVEWFLDGEGEGEDEKWVVIRWGCVVGEECGVVGEWEDFGVGWFEGGFGFDEEEVGGRESEV